MSALSEVAPALLRELKLNVRAWENAVEFGIIPDRYRHEAVVRIRDGLDVISKAETPSAVAPLEDALREIVKKWPDSAAARAARAALRSVEPRHPLVDAWHRETPA